MFFYSFGRSKGHREICIGNFLLLHVFDAGGKMEDNGCIFLFSEVSWVCALAHILDSSMVVGY